MKFLSREIELNDLSGRKRVCSQSVVDLERKDGGFVIRSIEPYEKETEAVTYIDGKVCFEEIADGLWTSSRSDIQKCMMKGPDSSTL